MKRIWTVIALWVFVWAAGTGTAPAAGFDDMKPVKLRLASAWPPPTVSLGSHATLYWMDLITKRTGGKVTFQAFWGGAMGKPPEYLNLVKMGTVDLVFTNGHYTPGYLPLAQFEYVFPFGPTDPMIVTKAKMQMYKEFPQFAGDLGKHNAIPIMNNAATVYNIMSKTPIKSLEDFRGKKIALIGRYFGRWFQPVGAVPVVAAAHDRYTMLQTGVTDMDFLPADLFSAFKVHEQAKYYNQIDSFTGNFFDLWMNKESFNRLPKEVQKVIVETAEEVSLKNAKEFVPEWTKRAEEIFRKAGIGFVPFPTALKDEWARKVSDIPAEWADEVVKQGYPGWEIVKRWQELTAQFGHKWPRKWGVKP